MTFFQPITLALMLFFGTIDVANMSSDLWPHSDDNGFYQSYKEKGYWINWWARNRPTGFSIARRFVFK